jgi:hypothetical protein
VSANLAVINTSNTREKSSVLRRGYCCGSYSSDSSAEMTVEDSFTTLILIAVCLCSSCINVERLLSTEMINSFGVR